MEQTTTQKTEKARQHLSELMLTNEMQDKINTTKLKNKSFNSSSIENQLCEYFKDNNIKFEFQYRSDVYPFNCDFYFPDADLYIEIQGTWTHGKHPYNPENSKDLEQLEEWKSKQESVYYKNAIKCWAVTDVKKRKIAEENKLNYLEIFSCDFQEALLEIGQKIRENYFKPTNK